VTLAETYPADARGQALEIDAFARPVCRLARVWQGHHRWRIFEGQVNQVPQSIVDFRNRLEEYTEKNERFAERCAAAL